MAFRVWPRRCAKPARPTRRCYRLAPRSARQALAAAPQPCAPGAQRWLPGTTQVLPRSGVKSSSNQNRLQIAGKVRRGRHLPLVPMQGLHVGTRTMKQARPSGWRPESACRADSPPGRRSPGAPPEFRNTLPLLTKFESCCLGPSIPGGASAPNERSAAACRSNRSLSASTSVPLNTPVKKHRPYSVRSALACSMSAVGAGNGNAIDPSSRGAAMYLVCRWAADGMAYSPRSELARGNYLNPIFSEWMIALNRPAYTCPLRTREVFHGDH